MTLIHPLLYRSPVTDVTIQCLVNLRIKRNQVPACMLQYLTNITSPLYSHPAAALIDLSFQVLGWKSMELHLHWFFQRVKCKF